MAEKRDYYEILKVGKLDDGVKIKKAYRKLALELHPDRNPGDAEAERRFKEASEAYEVLSDSQKRGIYDQLGHAGLEGRGFQGFHNMEDIFGSFGDIFEDFFGFGGGQARSKGRSRPSRGGDLQDSINISFRESAFGIEKKFNSYREANCDSCEGKGHAPGGAKTCDSCKGSGQSVHRQGLFMLQTTCGRCRGTGHQITDPCGDCRGQGLVRKKKELSLKVPPGIENGMSLVVRGEGNSGTNGGPSGDLYVQVNVGEDDFFERNGDDVHCLIPIGFSEAALGTKVKVPTLEKEKEVKIQEGIDSGQTITLKNLGFPNIRTKKRGDQILHIQVKTPKKLSRKHKQLLKELGEL